MSDTTNQTEAVQAELKRVLASPGFAASDRLARFLRFIVEETLAGRADHIKEYVIGTSVYDKPGDYDPKIDATVRGEASRLRTRLKEFYDGGAHSSSVRIEVPKGGYVPVFVAPAAVSEDRTNTNLTLAVLPFHPLMFPPDQESQALGLGLADAVITRIGPCRELLVRPTSAIRRYVGSTLDAIQAAAELRADVVLEGNLQCQANRLRVSAQLLRVSNGEHLWAGKYDQDLQDIFSVQDGLAEQLDRTLRLQLAAAGHSSRNSTGTQNFPAYAHYARGRFHLLKFTPEGAIKATGEFAQAVALDPRFARAHAELAMAYSQQADFFITTYKAVAPSMRTAVEQALALEPNLPETLVALGTFQFRCNWDWTKAESSFLTALTQNPNSTQAYVSYAQLLDALGRSQEAIALNKQALELDPASSLVCVWMSYSYWFLQKYEEAIRWAKRAVELDPYNPIAYARLARGHFGAGDFPAWAEAQFRSWELWGRGPAWIEGLREAFRTGGRDGLLRAGLPSAGQDPCGGAGAWVQSMAYAELGEQDMAFRCLEQAFEDRAVGLAFLKVNPSWVCLQADRRFQSLLQRVGLP